MAWWSVSCLVFLCHSFSLPIHAIFMLAYKSRFMTSWKYILMYVLYHRFMAASKVLGEETVTGSGGQSQGNERGNGS